MVSGSYDTTLRVWRLADGACLRTLTGHSDLVYAVVDVGGGRVASGGYDRVLRVWDVLSGKLLQHTPMCEDKTICASALWGNRIATGQWNEGEIRLWSLRDGGAAGPPLRGHMRAVTSLVVVGGGSAQRLLASGSEDHCVRLWDVDASTCTAVLSEHTSYVACLADLGGGRLLSGSRDRSLRVWNTSTGACLAVVQNAHGIGDAGELRGACGVPGGAATGSGGGSVQRWKWDEDASALRPEGAALELGQSAGWVYALAATPFVRVKAPAVGPTVRGPTVRGATATEMPVETPWAQQQLLTGCGDGSLRVRLGTAEVGTEEQLQQHEARALAGHSSAVRAVVVMNA